MKPNDDASSPPAAISDALAVALKMLDEEEIQYFTLNQIQGKTRSKCAAVLGWPMAKVERVRRRLNLHLGRLRSTLPTPLPAIASAGTESDAGADLEYRDARLKAKSPAIIYSFNRGGSLNPFYRERLSTGYAWALTPSDNLDFPNYRIVEAPTARKGAAPMNTIEGKLTEARKVLAPLLAKRDAIQERLDSLKEQRDSKKATAAAATTDKTVNTNIRLAIARLELEIAPLENDLQPTPKLAEEKRPDNWKPTTADLVAKQDQIVRDFEIQIIIAAREVVVEALLSKLDCERMSRI